MRLALGILLSCSFAVGCATDNEEVFDNDQPLTSVDNLLMGAPKADEVPRAGYKSDEVLPTRHVELISVMSPVKSQGKRGVCSVFSTTALMEHLYILGGAGTKDFSEQYLQWSVKFEVDSFPNSSGSNANFNMRAISEFGIVEESVWPFQIDQWGVDDDPACDGEDNQPTRCYTNGEPSDDVRSAEKFTLPRSRYVHWRDIKSHIANEGTAVVAGMTFFYQSWNHRKSELTVNSNSWDNGYVVYPSAEDKELSLAKRAGHSILLVGWDDELELPMLDSEGNPLVDGSGEPVVDRGCYVFKNSWGTGNFGKVSEFGDGYGCISQRYVHEYASLVHGDIPEVEEAVELCSDGVDNDNNGAVDCDDVACQDRPACETSSDELVVSSDNGVDIPDNDPAGATSTLTVVTLGRIADLYIEVDIEHTYRGDLRVSLVRDGEEVVLHNREGGARDNLEETFDASQFIGESIGGDWDLVVSDLAAEDVGMLRGWTLNAILATE